MGYESRQVFDIKVTRVVTEYRAQILEDSKAKRFVAQFPEEVTKAVQHGKSVKAHSVYMSQFQLIPYNRVEDYFKEQLKIPISGGSIYNFNREAYDLLWVFEKKVKSKLAESALMHVDETSINIGGDRYWLLLLYRRSSNILPCSQLLVHLSKTKCKYKHGFRFTISREIT